MSQQLPTKPSSKKLIKLLTKSIKEAVAKKEIHPTTRKGNKELSLLVKQLVQANLYDKEQAIAYGEKLGEVIAEFSQKNQKNYLDKGVIRQIALQKQLPSLPETAPEKNQATVATTTQKALKTETPIVEEKATEPVEKPSETKTESPVQEKEPASKQDSNSMSLKDRISEDIKLAMKAKDKVRLETVRSIKKVLLEKEVSVRPSGQDSLTPEQELEVLTQQAKQRRDSIEQYRNGGRDDLADKEAQELAIIETYLPKQLSDEEIGAVVDEIIASVGATTVKDLGKVMGAVMQQLKGKADGKKIQTMVKSKLEAK
jgi:uncharacterized protein YqeY